MVAHCSGSVLRDCCRMLLACGGSSGSILMDYYRMIVACGSLSVMSCWIAEE